MQTTTRVTSELQWADEDNQCRSSAASRPIRQPALGRALDYVIYHAINPKTGKALSGFDPLSTSAVQVIATEDEIGNVDALANALNDSYDINGVALSKTWASRLRKLRVPSTGMRFYRRSVEPARRQPGRHHRRDLRNRQRPTGQDPDEGARVHGGRFQPHQMGHGPRSTSRSSPTAIRIRPAWT